MAGRRPVEEAFVARREAHRLLVVPQRRQALERIVLHATNLRIPILEVEGGTLTALAGFDGHQGVALAVAPRRYSTIEAVIARARERDEPPFVLALDSLEDPQNVGTLLRSAEAAGVHGVLFPTRRQAPITPAAVKASAGAVEHLLLVPVDDLSAALADLHIKGLRVAGAEADAPLELRDADLRGPLALVVGSEGQGLGAAVRRRCDLMLRIPMRGHIGSLNAAVAGSIVLFEALGQRGGAAAGDGREMPLPSGRETPQASGAEEAPGEVTADDGAARPRGRTRGHGASASSGGEPGAAARRARARSSEPPTAASPVESVPAGAPSPEHTADADGALERAASADETGADGTGASGAPGSANSEATASPIALPRRRRSTTGAPAADRGRRVRSRGAGTTPDAAAGLASVDPTGGLPSEPVGGRAVEARRAGPRSRKADAMPQAGSAGSDAGGSDAADPNSADPNAASSIEAGSGAADSIAGGSDAERSGDSQDPGGPDGPEGDDPVLLPE